MKLLTRHVKGTRTRSRFGAVSVVGLAIAAGIATLSFGGDAMSAQATVDMGNAASFGALSAAGMTNAGQDTVVHGNIGSSTSIDSGVTHPGFAAYGPGSSQLAGAQASLLIAYGDAEAQTPTASITGENLAGVTLGPGVYNSSSDILISGPTALTLNGHGNPNAVFIFQAASSGNLTVDPTSSVSYTNGASPCNVFWKVNSAFLKNTDKTFIGTILALTQVTLTENITIQGRVLARNANVTFIHDTVNTPTCASTSGSGGGGGGGGGSGGGSGGGGGGSGGGGSGSGGGGGTGSPTATTGPGSTTSTGFAVPPRRRVALTG